MNHLTSRELSIAESCSYPSPFLEWLGYETKKKEVQDMQRMVCPVQHATETVHEDELHHGGWAPRARTPAEAGNTRMESGDKAAASKRNDSTRLD